MDIIYTHAHCQDGWAAAYIAKLVWPEAEIVPLEHYPDKTYIIEKSRGKDVVMLDFALKTREQNDELASVCKSFHILDHHKTAKETLEGAPYATFDMNRSGAGLAWDEIYNRLKLPIRFEGKETGDFIEAQPEPRPWWVNYTEDQDLWRWSLPNSKSIAGYLRTVPFTVEAWDSIRTLATMNSAHTLGLGVRAMIDYEVRELTQQAQLGHIFGHTCGVVNAGPNRAHICQNIREVYKVEIGMGWFERKDGQYQFFLCSDVNGVDVGEIAKRLGGGGHKTASGFEKPTQEGRQLLDVVLGRTEIDNRG